MLAWGSKRLLASTSRAAAPQHRLVLGASRSFQSQNKHEVWRDDNEQDNLPKVKKRDGTVSQIEKKRGFIDYHRNPDPYRDPLDRVFDWGTLRSSFPPTHSPSIAYSSLPFTHPPTHPLPLFTGEIKADEGHDEIERKVQAARCMDCGTPFCQTHTG